MEGALKLELALYADMHLNDIESVVNHCYF